MTDRTQPEALRLADALHAAVQTYPQASEDEPGGYCTEQDQLMDAAATELCVQYTRIAELEAQLSAIGAGGVSGPLMGQPQAMPDLSQLTERGAKAQAGVDAQGLCAGRKRGFMDGVSPLLDLATAEARGFRDGVASPSANAGEPSGHIKEPYTLAEIKAKIASNDYSAEMLLQHAMLLLDSASLAASAGSELVAQPGDAEAILSKICDLFFIGKLARNESTILTNIRNAIDHAGLLHAVERDLFPQPELPEDDDPYAAVDEGLPAPNSWAAKDEADYVAQFRAALAARGFNAQGLRDGAASAGGRWRGNTAACATTAHGLTAQKSALK